jgi:hypothetical protein
MIFFFIIFKIIIKCICKKVELNRFAVVFPIARGFVL